MFGRNKRPVFGSPHNIRTRKKVYFAGPMFNQAEKEYNLELAEVLEAYGYEVFLPQRDGIEAALLESRSEEEMTEIFLNWMPMRFRRRISSL